MTLRRGPSVPDLAGTPIRNLLVEPAFGVFLPTLIGLVDGNGNEVVLQESDDLGMTEARLTVEHSIVSRAP
jgi:hypothetical protein